MKKLLATAVIITIFSPFITSAKNFTGPYVGMGFGINSLRSEYKQTSFDSTNYARSTNTGGTLFNGALFGGYGKTFGQFYVGGELVVALTSGNVPAGTIDSNTGISEPGKFQSKWSINPLFRVGGLIAPKTLAYIKAGMANTGFEITSIGGTDSNNQYTTYKKNIWGFSTGAGLETLITEKISIRLDYTFNLYPKKTWPVGGGATPDTGKIMPRENIVRIGAAYNF